MINSDRKNKEVTSYYHDCLCNKLMTKAEEDLDSVGTVGYRCNNDTKMNYLYTSCTECVDALRPLTKYQMAMYLKSISIEKESYDELSNKVKNWNN